MENERNSIELKQELEKSEAERKRLQNELTKAHFEIQLMRAREKERIARGKANANEAYTGIAEE